MGSITWLGAGTSLGKQARGFCALALKPLASGHFGVDPQRPEHFESVAILQGMRHFNRFAPDSDLPWLRRLRRKSSAMQMQKSHGLRDSGTGVCLPHQCLHLTLGGGAHDFYIHR
jgi:hypothetical protein